MKTLNLLSFKQNKTWFSNLENKTFKNTFPYPGGYELSWYDQTVDYLKWFWNIVR